MPGPVPYKIIRLEDAKRIAEILDGRHPDRAHKPIRSSKRINGCWRIEIMKRETGEHIGLVMV
jgi:hypothetical protein